MKLVQENKRINEGSEEGKKLDWSTYTPPKRPEPIDYGIHRTNKCVRNSRWFNTGLPKDLDCDSRELYKPNFK